MSDREHLIRERAYDLWEQAGRPGGRDNEFWELACREVVAERTGEDPVPIDLVAEPAESPRAVRGDIDQLTPQQATETTMPATAEEPSDSHAQEVSRTAI